VTAALALASAACSGGGERIPTFSARGAPTAGELVTRAEETRARLARRELPPGVDQLVADLEAAAVAEGGSARAQEALRAAGDLLAARYRVTRARPDAERAEVLLLRAAQREGEGACEALAASGGLLLASGERARARARYLEYERRCPRGAALAHVHATLALLDPAAARAEAEAAQARQTARSTRGEGPGRTRLRRIVIDPGHGGSDPGARGHGGLTESAVTLDVARRLADRVVTTLGVEVMLTRDADEYVPLEDRAARANNAGADLFVSIHCNSSENPASRGVSTYVLDTTSDAIAARIAARENGAFERDPLADPEVFRILADLRLVGQGSRSLRLAEGIQQSILATLAPRYPDVVDLGVHPARFHVLVGARMPAVLVELSFVSNPVEAARLRDPGYRDDLARAITAAIARWRE
jgi:N-acetylmuramoyl-L-alanine amidase